MEDDVWSMLYLFSGAKMLRFQKDAGESAGSARRLNVSRGFWGLDGFFLTRRHKGGGFHVDGFTIKGLRILRDCF